MKKIIFSLALISLALLVFPSCEKKSKGEKFLENVKEETEEASEEIEEKVEEGAEETEKGAKKTKRKIKDLLE